MNYDAVNLELLRIARELVVNEYTDRRAEMHNKWLVESEHLWRTQRLRLAYPTIPSPPRESDILEVAKKLMEFVSKEADPPKEELPVVEQVVAVEEVPVIEEPPLPEPEVPLPEPKYLPEPVSEPQGRVLPRVLQKLEDMKRNLF